MTQNNSVISFDTKCKIKLFEIDHQQVEIMSPVKLEPH